MIEQSAVDEVIRRAHDPAGAREELGEALGAAFGDLGPGDRGAAEAAIRRLADEVIDAPSRTDAAGLTALYCGALVEHGLAPTIALGAILDRIERQVAPEALAFVSACAEAAGEGPKPAAQGSEGGVDPVELHGERIAELMPAEARSFQSLEPFSMAAVAMLGRSVESRKASWSRADLRSALDALGGQYGHAGWLWMMMQVLDDEPLLVLHPGEGKGYRVRISGLADNFQLHTLLADALIGRLPGPWLRGRRPSSAEVAAARDGQVDENGPTAKGAFNLWTWRGLQPDGTLGEARAGSQHWVWNEGVPADIPPFEGVRVVLLGPPPYDRSWTAGRKFPPMAGELKVEGRLARDEVREILGRIAAAATE